MYSSVRKVQGISAIRPNLRAWLDAYPLPETGTTQCLTLDRFRKNIRAIAHTAGIAWGHDIFRHYRGLVPPPLAPAKPTSPSPPIFNDFLVTHRIINCKIDTASLFIISGSWVRIQPSAPDLSPAS